MDHLLEKIKKIERKKHTVCDVDFYDVIEITESNSEPGRTSIPGYWRANVNFRFAPVYTEAEAKQYLLNLINSYEIKNLEVNVKDISPSAKVIESDLFLEVIKKMGIKIQAKQAWTDVAQLAGLNIPCFNFGPGHSAQCHVEDEYASLDSISTYDNLLSKAFLD